MNQSEYENLIEELEKLKELSRHTPVVVEGRKDAAALRNMGLKCDFLEVSNGMPIYEFCEMVAERYSDVILFTDLDRAGCRLARKLKSNLSQRGVRINDRYRQSVMSKLDTHQVESLYKRMLRVQQVLKKI